MLILLIGVQWFLLNGTECVLLRDYDSKENVGESSLTKIILASLIRT